MELNSTYAQIKDAYARDRAEGVSLTMKPNKERLEEVSRELEDPKIWDNPQKAQTLGKERSTLEAIVGGIDRISRGLADANELLELAEMEDDQASADAVIADVQGLEAQIAQLEFERMFSGEMDRNNAFLDIQSGAGTEGQDWAEK